MDARFEQKVSDAKVTHDLGVIADFTAIWCQGHHAQRERAVADTQASRLGVYGERSPLLCAECAAHLEYAEKRRAYCPKDPKPFCAHCDTHCYKSDERDWQRDMMRYSGPRSWYRGHAVDGIRHAIEGLAHRRRAKNENMADSGRF